jgi:hypothetical protein
VKAFAGAASTVRPTAEPSAQLSVDREVNHLVGRCLRTNPWRLLGGVRVWVRLARTSRIGAVSLGAGQGD